ncbi:hypothetical protein TcasGA2_TC010555 [Tribolium castaneum]|uniref:Uncharacterized protein n=1 Tax=Tribolium castaneum TaxID=7070 RepID=D6WE63_TRICA|nr:hypothetical protein TcasGA2_TC010555 [Tribolium castaneum]
MSYKHKSGCAKRKEKAASEEKKKKMPKIDHFFLKKRKTESVSINYAVSTSIIEYNLSIIDIVRQRLTRIHCYVYNKRRLQNTNRKQEFDDLSEYIKNHLYLLHKKKSDLIGTLQERVMKMNTQRKESRLDDALGKRRRKT